MKRVKIIVAAILLLTVVVAGAATSRTIIAPKGPTFTADGKLVQPTGYRQWTFMESMVTPNGLNNGKAGFPEFHNVYVEQVNLDAYKKTGSFPEGIVIVKELTLVRNPKYPGGSTDEASGRGLFEGEFSGMDVTVKDSKRFSKTNNWGFFNFGHHALPYAKTSAEATKEECAACHIAGAAKTDMAWVQFYPVLNAT